ncbi:MAG TPA: YjjG family noncanonical pyrimidine nucleotidase [Chryseosolibacter sp.]
MKPYKVIFFDLDHTLWDYESNSCETLQELFDSYELQTNGVIDCKSFQQQFKKVNTELWELYDRGLITNEVIRKERFKQILAHFNIQNEELCEKLSVDYLYACPKKSALIPFAMETLTYLADHYPMTIVTNGFEEIQHLKLTAGNITRYFDHIITSQKAGAKKPSRQIFDYAMKVNNVRPHEVVMIGDNLITDIGGALNASIDTIYFNPEKIEHDVEVKYEISCLSELQNIL